MFTSTPLHIIAQEGLSTVYNKFMSNPRKDISGPEISESAASDTDLLGILWSKSTEDLEFGTPNSLDSSNDPPLHLAASEGHIEMTSLLLGSGADPWRC